MAVSLYISQETPLLYICLLNEVLYHSPRIFCLACEYRRYAPRIFASFMSAAHILLVGTHFDSTFSELGLTLYHIFTPSSFIGLLSSTLSRRTSSRFCGASPFQLVGDSSRGNPICSTMNEDDTVAYRAAIYQLPILQTDMTNLHMDPLLICVVQQHIPLGTSCQLIYQLHHHQSYAGTYHLRHR